MDPVPLVRKVGRSAMQVAIPREFVGALTGAPFADDDAFDQCFGVPPRVVLEVTGDPPEAVVVWPLLTWQRAKGLV